MWGCKCHIYDANVAFSYFSLIEITIFHHILLGNNNASGCNLCMCINVLLVFIKKNLLKEKIVCKKKRKIIFLRFWKCYEIKRSYWLVNIILQFLKCCAWGDTWFKQQQYTKGKSYWLLCIMKKVQGLRYGTPLLNIHILNFLLNCKKIGQNPTSFLIFSLNFQFTTCSSYLHNWCTVVCQFIVFSFNCNLGSIWVIEKGHFRAKLILRN